MKKMMIAGMMMLGMMCNAEEMIYCDGSAQKKVTEAGGIWGSPDKRHGDGIGAIVARELVEQYEKYMEAKEDKDWMTARKYALRTWIKATLDNRMARELKEAAIIMGKVKTKKGITEGIVAIDREKINQSINIYKTAIMTAEEAIGKQQETEELSIQSIKEANKAKEQAKGNIVWLESLLNDPNFDADGNNKWAIK